MFVVVFSSLQVLIAQTQMNPSASGSSSTLVDGTWQPNAWQADVWTGQNKWHDWYMNSDVAYIWFAGWDGINSWGNTEYEQGRDPWGVYGMPFHAVPLTLAQQVTVTLRIVEAKVDAWAGVADAYVDLWVNFSQPVGTKGFVWAELIIYLKVEKGFFYPFPEQDSYSNMLRSDGALNWYMIGYRSQDVNSGWSTRTINVNALANRLAQDYHVDISRGTVSCVTFGIEGAQGEMTAQWNNMKFEHAL